ncbi:MAG: hypothetical protein AAF430_22075 [Myxococcota bacterium]
MEHAEGTSRTLVQLRQGIERCVAEGLPIPALILLYTGIDALSWLTAPADQSVRESFTRWVDSYLLPDSALECTALELYAARCGLLHTLTPDSRVGAKFGVRSIGYSYGQSDFDAISNAMKALAPDQFVAVRVEELVSAFVEAVRRYLKRIAIDDVLFERFRERSSKHFTSVPEDLAPFLAEFGVRSRSD